MGSDKLCLALDVATFGEAKVLIDELHGSVGVFKIGKELFTGVGPKIVEYAHDKKSRVFLDLKFHDIPNTVRKASEAAARMGVFRFNVHASGGSEMMKAAVQGVKDSGNTKTLVLGVTVLTSMNEVVLKNEIHVTGNLQDHVIHLAKLAQTSGLSGIVASPQEIKLIRQACGPDFKIVTPAVRPEWASQDDQKRVMTPREAIQSGADFIVVGRPILKASNRREAAEKIIKEISV
jgi:orotidine-5'-phosphate decarboxylase